MWIVVLLFLLAVVLVIFLDTRKPHNFPPGPLWLPILGSALAVMKARKETNYLVKGASLLSRQYSSRGVIGLKIGKDRIVMTCDQNSIREMLLNEDIDGRPRGLFYETRTWGKCRGVIFTEEGIWKDQRRFIIRHLKEFGFGRRGMVNIVQSEAEQLLIDMRSKVGGDNNNSAIIQMDEAFSVYVLNTLWTMMAGIRYSGDDEEMIYLQKILHELFASIDMVGTLFSHFPITRFLAPELSGYTSFVDIHKRIWEFLRKELDIHKERFKLENPDKDFMDAYIRMLKCPDKEKSFTESQLLAVCMDMFMAGSETTAKSLGFVFLYFVREQEVQKKAQREIDTVIGKDRLPTVDDRINLPYNEAVVLESIRHFMGRTLGIPHRALRDTKLCGFTIPKDTMIISNFHEIFMNSDVFENPQEFRPERFLVDGKIVIPESYIPFGIGKRRCMGESLARTNIFLITVTMLQHFEFKIPPGQSLPTEETIDGATSSVTPFQALVVPRHV